MTPGRSGCTPHCSAWTATRLQQLLNLEEMAAHQVAVANHRVQSRCEPPKDQVSGGMLCFELLESDPQVSLILPFCLVTHQVISCSKGWDGRLSTAEEIYLPALWILSLPDGFDVAHREYEISLLEHPAVKKASRTQPPMFGMAEREMQSADALVAATSPAIIDCTIAAGKPLTLCLGGQNSTPI